MHIIPTTERPRPCFVCGTKTWRLYGTRNLPLCGECHKRELAQDERGEQPRS